MASNCHSKHGLTFPIGLSQKLHTRAEYPSTIRRRWSTTTLLSSHAPILLARRPGTEVPPVVTVSHSVIIQRTLAADLAGAVEKRIALFFSAIFTSLLVCLDKASSTCRPLASPSLLLWQLQTSTTPTRIRRSCQTNLQSLHENGPNRWFTAFYSQHSSSPYPSESLKSR